MKKNVGNADRLIRLLFVAAIVVLYFLNIINGPVAIVLFVLAGILLITSLAGFCPLYALLGINSCPAKAHK